MKVESQCFETALLGQRRIKWHGYKEFFKANFGPEKCNVGILYQNKNFEGLGNYTGYWTSSENTSFENLGEFYNLDLANDELYANNYYKTGGYSVRCIKD